MASNRTLRTVKIRNIVTEIRITLISSLIDNTWLMREPLKFFKFNCKKQKKMENPRIVGYIFVCILEIANRD